MKKRLRKTKQVEMNNMSDTVIFRAEPEKIVNDDDGDGKEKKIFFPPNCQPLNHNKNHPLHVPSFCVFHPFNVNPQFFVAMFFFPFYYAFVLV